MGLQRYAVLENGDLLTAVFLIAGLLAPGILQNIRKQFFCQVTALQYTAGIKIDPLLLFTAKR